MDLYSGVVIFVLLFFIVQLRSLNSLGRFCLFVVFSLTVSEY